MRDETKGDKLKWNSIATHAVDDEGEWTQYEVILSLPEIHNYGFLYIGRGSQTEGGAIFLVDDILIESLSELAVSAINNAEQTILDMKAGGIILTDAEGMLTEAKNTFEAGDYIGTEILADQAVSLAYSTEQMAETASSAIQEAQTAMEEAGVE